MRMMPLIKDPFSAKTRGKSIGRFHDTARTKEKWQTLVAPHIDHDIGWSSIELVFGNEVPHPGRAPKEPLTTGDYVQGASYEKCREAWKNNYTLTVPSNHSVCESEMLNWSRLCHALTATIAERATYNPVTKLYEHQSEYDKVCHKE